MQSCRLASLRRSRQTFANQSRRRSARRRWMRPLTPSPPAGSNSRRRVRAACWSMACVPMPVRKHKRPNKLRAPNKPRDLSRLKLLRRSRLSSSR